MKVIQKLIYLVLAVVIISIASFNVSLGERAPRFYSVLFEYTKNKIVQKGQPPVYVPVFSGGIFNSQMSVKAVKKIKQKPKPKILEIKKIEKITYDHSISQTVKGTAIYIDLSAQKLFLYVNGKLNKTFPVSTGKWSTPTPVGQFAINNKKRLAYSGTYGLYMPYWMSFIGGLYGIHELPYWPNGYREGQNHLGIPVSHGCIRLGIGAAPYVYSKVGIGTPVNIHY